jgi:hypothetical protein
MRQRAYDKPGPSIFLRLLSAESFDERLSCVEDAVNFAIEILVENRHLKQNLSEDQRTSEIVGNLKAMGFTANHDEQIGGHVDIVVRTHGLLWLGEAKNWKGCDWASRGMRQLLTRYSTGLPGQSSGGIILYFEQRDAAALMTTWRDHMVSEQLARSIDAISELSFRSHHDHVSTGTRFSVRHYPVPLYWRPLA